MLDNKTLGLKTLRSIIVNHQLRALKTSISAKAMSYMHEYFIIIIGFRHLATIIFLCIKPSVVLVVSNCFSLVLVQNTKMM